MPEKSLYDIQLAFEQKYNKNQLWSRLRKEVRQQQELLNIMSKNAIPEDFGVDVIAYMTQYKRCTVPTLVGLLRRHFNDSQKTADMLMKCVEADLVDFDENSQKFILKYDIDLTTQMELNLYQFPLPMVIKPRKIKSNKETGYLTYRSSVILAHQYHENDVCIEHLNKMNAIAFTFNNKVIENCKNQWKDLDKKKPDESIVQYQQRKKAFTVFDNRSRQIIKEIQEVSPKFYLTHAFDKRGRCYCRGYHVNYQGNDWCKAVVLFSRKEVVKCSTLAEGSTFS